MSVCVSVCVCVDCVHACFGLLETILFTVIQRAAVTAAGDGGVLCSLYLNVLYLIAPHSSS